MLFDVSKLDIVITRTCQLNCAGCLTFSNHNRVKGHIELDTAKPWLEFWASKLKPETIHVFGGEPLMNPEFPTWVRTVAELFRSDRCKQINAQTNGIKISSMDSAVLFDLIHNYNLQLSISIHSQETWYQEKISEAVKILETIVGPGRYEEVNGSERVYISEDDLRNFRLVNHSVGDPNRRWVGHYNGYGKNLTPGREFEHAKHIEHHGFCEAKEYIQLYEGKLYKCPPMAILKHALEMYEYPNREQWQPWLDYQPLAVDATDAEIAQWLAVQAGPEKYCNMCFDAEPAHVVHTLKVREND